MPTLVCVFHADAVTTARGIAEAMARTQASPGAGLSVTPAGFRRYRCVVNAS